SGHGLDYSLADLFQRRVRRPHQVHAESWYVLPRRAHLAIRFPSLPVGVPTKIGQRLRSHTHPRLANHPEPLEAAVQGSVPSLFSPVHHGFLSPPLPRLTLPCTLPPIAIPPLPAATVPGP